MTSSPLRSLIHVMSASTNVSKLMRQICESGVQQEAFSVFDVGDVIRKHNEWQTKMPRVTPFYAVKCNDHEIVLKLLAALGTGFDCASKSEIDRILDLGVAPDRIIYSNPSKCVTYIQHAAEQGVELMVFDNEDELKKIKATCPKAKLVIRITTDADNGKFDTGMKFGCHPQTAAPHLMRVAKQHNLEIVGVCFHIGGGCEENPLVFKRAIAHAQELFLLGKKLGYAMWLVNLGGGFPGARGKSIDELSDVINDALKEYFPSTDVTIIAEPGRYYVTSACTLATRIHSKREVFAEGQEVRGDPIHVNYHINDGIYSSFRLTATHGDVSLPRPLRPVVGKLIPSTVFGQTCDGMDKVNDLVHLPNLPLEDWLIYDDKGAYTRPMSCGFNGFYLPKLNPVVDEKTWKLLLKLWPGEENRFVADTDPGSLRVGLD